MALIFPDAHTHHSLTEGLSLLNIHPGKDTIPQEPNRFFSAGIHPWFLTHSFETEFKLLTTLVENPAMAAMGECGLDSCRGPGLKIQEEAFALQVHLASEKSLPLIIHCVRQEDRLISILKSLRFSDPVVIHGFRSGIRRLKNYLDKDYYISLGADFLTRFQDGREALRLIPSDRLLFETDEHPLPVKELYILAAQILNVDPFLMRAQIFKNFINCFPKIHVPLD